MRVYPLLAAASVLIVVVLESAVLRTGLFRRSSYWIAMAIVYAFMIPVDGWLTKLSSPIVLYAPNDVSGWRPIWDILAEEYLYAFSLLTAVLVLWEHAGDDGKGPRERAAPRATTVDSERVTGSAGDRVSATGDLPRQRMSADVDARLGSLDSARSYGPGARP